jgi:hypothetical protein
MLLFQMWRWLLPKWPSAAATLVSFVSNRLLSGQPL